MAGRRSPADLGPARRALTKAARREVGGCREAGTTRGPRTGTVASRPVAELCALPFTSARPCDSIPGWFCSGGRFLHLTASCPGQPCTEFDHPRLHPLPRQELQCQGRPLTQRPLFSCCPLPQRLPKSAYAWPRSVSASWSKASKITPSSSSTRRGRWSVGMRGRSASSGTRRRRSSANPTPASFPPKTWRSASPRKNCGGRWRTGGSRSSSGRCARTGSTSGAAG